MIEPFSKETLVMGHPVSRVILQILFYLKNPNGKSGRSN